MQDAPKSSTNNKRRKDSAIAGQAEDKQERITKLKGQLDRHRSEFCLSYNTCTGNVTAIELATFFAQGITNNTPCASCVMPIIGHCAKRAYLVKPHDGTKPGYYIHDKCFGCHYAISLGARTCGAKQNMLWKGPDSSSSLGTLFSHLDRNFLPVCRYHVDAHALNVPSFDPATQHDDMIEFHRRWGFVKVRTTADAANMTRLREGLVDLLAIMNNRTPEEMREKISGDIWDADCAWFGDKHQEFGNVCDKVSDKQSYSTLVQDRRAWEARKFAWPALLPFFDPDDNVCASMSPFVVIPKTETLSRSFLRSLLMDARANHEVFNGFFPFTDTRYNTCGISMIVGPESWELQTVDDGASTETYSFQHLWKGVVPTAYAHGVYPEDFPFNNTPVPIDTNVGEFVLFKGERPFRLAAPTDNLFGMFVGAVNIAPKDVTKKGRAEMVLEQHVRKKLFNWCFFIYPHQEDKGSTYALKLPNPDDPSNKKKKEEEWSVRTLDHFTGYTEKMDLGDLYEYAELIFGTKHAAYSNWPDSIKKMHDGGGGPAPLDVNSDTIAATFESQRVVVICRPDNKFGNVQRKKKKSGVPTSDNNATTTMNHQQQPVTTTTTPTSAKAKSKRDHVMQTNPSTTTTIAPPPPPPPRKTAITAKPKPVGVDAQRLDRQVEKHIKAHVKPSPVSPTIYGDPDHDDEEEEVVKTVTSIAKRKKKKIATPIVPPEPEPEPEEEDNDDGSIQPMQQEEEEEEDQLMAVSAEEEEHVKTIVPKKKKKKIAEIQQEEEDAMMEEEDEEEPEATTSTKKKRSRPAAQSRSKTAGLPDGFLYDAEEVADALTRLDVPVHLRIHPDFMETHRDTLTATILDHLFAAGPGSPSPYVDPDTADECVTTLPVTDEKGKTIRHELTVDIPLNNGIRVKMLDFFSACGIPDDLESELREHVVEEFNVPQNPVKVAGRDIPSNKVTRLYGCRGRLAGKPKEPDPMPVAVEQLLTYVNLNFVHDILKDVEPFNQVIACTFQTVGASGNTIKFDQCAPGSMVLVVPLGYSGRYLQLRSHTPGVAVQANAKTVPILHNIVMVSGVGYMFESDIHAAKELSCSLEIKQEGKGQYSCSPFTLLVFMTVNEIAASKPRKKSTPAASASKPKAAAVAATLPSPPSPAAKPKTNKKAKVVVAEEDEEKVAPAVTKIVKSAPKPATTKKKSTAITAPVAGKAKSLSSIPDVSAEWDGDELNRQYADLFTKHGGAGSTHKEAMVRNAWQALQKCANTFKTFKGKVPEHLVRFKYAFNACHALANPPKQEEEEQVEEDNGEQMDMDLGDDDLVIEEDHDHDQDQEEEEEQKSVVIPGKKNKKTTQSTLFATMPMKPRSNTAPIPVAVSAVPGRKTVLQGDKLVKQSTRKRQAAENKQAIAAENVIPLAKSNYASWARLQRRKGITPVSFDIWWKRTSGKSAGSTAAKEYEVEDDDQDEDDEEEDGDFDSAHGFGIDDGERDQDDDDNSSNQSDDDDDDDDEPQDPKDAISEAAATIGLHLDACRNLVPDLFVSGPRQQKCISIPFERAYSAVTAAGEKRTDASLKNVQQALAIFNNAFTAYMNRHPDTAKLIAPLFPRKKQQQDPASSSSPGQRAVIVDTLVAEGADVTIQGWNPRVSDDISHQFVLSLMDAVVTLSGAHKSALKLAIFLKKNFISKATNVTGFTAENMRKLAEEVWPQEKSLMEQGKTRQTALPIPDDDDNAPTLVPPPTVPEPQPPKDKEEEEKQQQVPQPPPSSVIEAEQFEEEDEDEYEEDEEEEEDEKHSSSVSKNKTTTTRIAVPLPVPVPMSEDDDHDDEEPSYSSSTGGGGEQEDGPVVVAVAVAGEEQGDDNDPQGQGSDAEAAKDRVVVALAVSPKKKNVMKNPPSSINHNHHHDQTPASLDVLMEPDIPQPAPTPKKSAASTTTVGHAYGTQWVAYQKGSNEIFLLDDNGEKLRKRIEAQNPNLDLFVIRETPANWADICAHKQLARVPFSLKSLKVSDIWPPK